MFKFATGNIVAALSAGIVAFGSAYSLAFGNSTPGVQPLEWLSIASAVLSAVGAAFYHNDSK